jgi:hypothetical protein
MRMVTATLDSIVRARLAVEHDRAAARSRGVVIIGCPHYRCHHTETADTEGKAWAKVHTHLRAKHFWMGPS